MGTQEARHTPGPWTYQFVEGGGYDCMTDSFLIMDAESRTRFIADVDLSHYGQGWRSKASKDKRSEAEANARLIAAAPELLAVCRDFVEWEAWDGEGPNVKSLPSILATMRSLLQSATGAPEDAT